MFPFLLIRLRLTTVPYSKQCQRRYGVLGASILLQETSAKLRRSCKAADAVDKKGTGIYLGSPSARSFWGSEGKVYITLVLAYPNFKLPFILTTDASKTAIAAILSQLQDEIERPTAYASRQLNIRNRHIQPQRSKCQSLCGLSSTSVVTCLERNSWSEPITLS